MGLDIGHGLFIVPEAWQAPLPSQSKTRGPEEAAAGIPQTRTCRCCHPLVRMQGAEPPLSAPRWLSPLKQQQRAHMQEH